MPLIDKYEQKVIAITGVLLSLFIFSILYARNKYSDAPVCLPYDKAYEEPKVVKLNDKTYQVYAVAQMWSFLPADIIIPEGSEVDFYLTSKDVVHGFNIYKKNVNLMAIYGTVNKYTVKFDDPGTYTITCHEYCGLGHQNMQGNVVVTESISIKD